MTPPTPYKHAPLTSAVLVTGKGGVGKTTVAAGLAVSAARIGRHAVFVEFGDGDSGRRALGDDADGIEHIVIHPDDAIALATTPLFGSAMAAKLVLGNFAMRRMFRAAPALRELSILEVVRQIVVNHPHQRVVVDMPATGHGLGWLRVPEQVLAISGPGPFRNLVARIVNELIAPGKCSVVVVTLPERLVLQETVELCEAMPREVGVEAARIIVNRMPAATPEGALEEARELVTRGGAVGEAAARLVQALEVRQGARALGMEALHVVLEAHGIHAVVLPLSPIDPSAAQVAGWLEKEGAA